MTFTKTDRFHQVCLAVLEVVVASLFLIARYVDLSFLDLWQAWLGMMLFWLVFLLLVASWRLRAKHRLLARMGLSLVALILLCALCSIFLSGR